MSRASWAAVALFLAGGIGAGPAGANVVTDWNKTTIDTTRNAKWSGIRATRAIAIVEAAVFDAVNAVDHRFKPYLFAGAAPPGASDVAAASEAAFKTLSTLAPDQAARLAAENERALASVADPAARAAGIAIGDAAAMAILADRANDNFDDSVDPPPPPGGPGVYQATEPGPMFPQHFPRMRPFALTTSAEFRLPPPPPLDSSQFLRDLAEVRDKGDARKSPSDEHVEIVKFHAPPGYFAWNDIARQAAIADNLDIAATAHALALLDFTVSDSFEASFESKNAYQFWRPKTAVQAGGAGFGHPEIAPDPDWASIIPAPLFAEYPCMHCAIGAAAQTVLESLFPNGRPFTLVGGGGKSRSFRDFRQFAEEEAESRVLGGVHYRWSVVAGRAQGVAVSHVDMTLLAPAN
jgi:hypothetical protein